MPNGTTFHRIPKYPQELPENATLQQKIKHRGMLEEFTSISGAGGKSSSIPSQDSRGVGKDRSLSGPLKVLQEKKKRAKSPSASSPGLSGDKETELEKERRLRKEAEGEAAEAWLVAQQVVECHSPESTESTLPISPAVSKAAGLVSSKEKTQGSPHSKRLFCFKVIPKDADPNETNPKETKKGVKRGNSNKASAPPKKRRLNRVADMPPKVLPSMPDKQVKRRTGFSSLQSMYAYIILICNGDFDRMRKRKTPLTWLEEWFLYFEWKWHQTNQRVIDLEDEYDIHHERICDVKDCKGALEMAALLSWPRFASFEED